MLIKTARAKFDNKDRGSSILRGAKGIEADRIMQDEDKRAGVQVYVLDDARRVESEVAQKGPSSPDWNWVSLSLNSHKRKFP